MTLLAPTSLLIPAGENGNAQRFVLASRDWIDLQNRVHCVLALPSDLGEYEERYGDAASATHMKECFDAMHRLQKSAARYGSPQQLRTKILNNPGFLAGVARPRNDAFSATVWTLERAHRDCAALVDAFLSIPQLARHDLPQEASAAIKRRFLDRAQIVDNMQHTVDQLDVLIAEFAAIDTELDAAQRKMKHYTGRASATRVALEKEIGALAEPIAQLEKSQAEAYAKWLALAVGAGTMPSSLGIIGTAIMVMLALPSGGAGFAFGGAITGGPLVAGAAAVGEAAGVARVAYEELVDHVEAEDEDLLKRVNYRIDLGALEEMMKFMLPASNGIIGQLGEIRSAWVGALREIGARANEVSVDNLRSGPWLKELYMKTSAAGWSDIDRALHAFNDGAFVDATLLDFGAALPPAHADWQKLFMLKKAA